MNKYEVLGVVGEGAYGIVYKCRNKENNQIVAIKKFKEVEDELVKKTMKRELKILQLLHHPNIVGFLDAFRRKNNLFLVFEFCSKNLLELLNEFPTGLNPNLIRKFIFQLCKAIQYLHSQNMIHRDIKPENLLLTEDNEIKLCDFGFARVIRGGPTEKLTDYVATRWYRAPELLLTNGDYGKEVDFWAIGCIMGELVDGNPLFPGENEIDQLHCIQKVMGNFTNEQVDLFIKNPIYQGKYLLNVTKPETLERRYLGKLSKKAINFMKGLLEMDPKKRLNGESVFMHPYLRGLVEEEKEREIKEMENRNIKGNRIYNNNTNNNNENSPNTLEITNRQNAKEEEGKENIKNAGKLNEKENSSKNIGTLSNNNGKEYKERGKESTKDCIENYNSNNNNANNNNNNNNNTNNIINNNNDKKLTNNNSGVSLTQMVKIKIINTNNQNSNINSINTNGQNSNRNYNPSNNNNNNNKANDSGNKQNDINHNVNENNNNNKLNEQSPRNNNNINKVNITNIHIIEENKENKINENDRTFRRINDDYINEVNINNYYKKNSKSKEKSINKSKSKEKQANKLATSINFNKVDKNKLKTLKNKYIDNPNGNYIDNAYKTFYKKNKDKDIYNIELDFQNFHPSDSSENIKKNNHVNNYEVINEEDEFTQNEKMKLKQLAALYKPNNKHKNTNSQGKTKYKNSPPKNYYYQNKNGNNGYKCNNSNFLLPVIANKNIPLYTGNNFGNSFKKFSYY